MATVVLALAALFADHQNRVLSEQSLRTEVASHVNLIRAKLEGNINADIQLVRGLVATIVTEPHMQQDRFAQLAENVFREQSQLRNIAGAPGLVISLMYPLDGNEKAVGLDYRKDEKQREAALRARDSHEMVLAGPVDLRQGGQGFVGRFPVFLNRGRSDEIFWGVVSAVIDMHKLYRNSGLLDDNLPIEIALTGKDALGGRGTRFYGDARIVEDNPVTAQILLPTGSWQLAAVPVGGWDTARANTWLLRAIMLAGGLLVVGPIMVASGLFRERQEHYRELHNSEQRLRRLSRRLELALDASQLGAWEHDLETNVLWWDDRLNEIYGKPANGKPRSFEDWAGTIHPADLERAKIDFERGAASGSYSSEYRLLLPDGQIRHVRARAIRYQDGDETPKLVGADWDVTADILLTRELESAKNLAEIRNAELVEAQSRIEHDALHDSLTGLPNRRYLDSELKRTGSFESEQTAILHIDLDRFKQINDTLGHAAGDAMLIHAAAILKSAVRPADFVARIGGDEFVVLCRSGLDPNQLGMLADEIISQMRQPVNYHGHQCRFGVSIGIALEAADMADPRRLLVNADIALYRAKSMGRNRHEFFSETLQAEIVRTKRVADEILSGLERNEFCAHYQLQFDARTLEIAGVEALARWNHPREGLLTPDAFLNIAEELNVVADIDQVILEQTLHNFEKWRLAGLPIPRTSVNVSARRLRDEELIKNLSQLAIPSGLVSFELVESIFLDENDEAVVRNVEQIKKLGIDIEIDDFGTGYASIVSLLRLQPRRLKIARQLVIPIVESSKQRQVVASIIEIGKSLGIEVVAEGVETMKHAETLRDLGCDLLQGFALSRPMSETALAEFACARYRRAI
ncbi:histidine kinase [Mesorhizobium sp. Root157]|nr:histidine kinase [Mesorhizobium sp. Root157]